MKKEEIPVMFCFDNNYVIPAAVAFYSMLEHANREYYYKMYVLHTDITEENQKKLIENIQKFSDFSELIFVNMENKFEDLWETISTKGHFSKEVMYKILVASIFPIYEKIIVSDVDVVFLNDISQSYFELNTNEDYYLAGVKMIGKMQWYLDQLEGIFTKEEIIKLGGFCGGYIVFNLRKLREDKMEDKFVKCFVEEGYRINQMEQDVLNLCCYPKTKRLPLKYIACSYMWDVYKTQDDMKNDGHYSEEEIEDAMTNTVQLHFATSKKPWKYVDSSKSEVWFEYLSKTNYAKQFFSELPHKIVIPEDRIQNIENECIEKYREQIEHEVRAKITNEMKKKLSTRGRLNTRFGKNIFFRAIKYFFRHPFFLFKREFYERLCKKFDKQNYTLLILDDVFPSELSPFRFEEYMQYFNEFNSVKVLTTGMCLQSLGEKRTLKEVISDYESKYPQFKGRIFEANNKNKGIISKEKNLIAVITFLQNVIGSQYDTLEWLEENNIPFIFTLYPGGGFCFDDSETDEKLKRIFKSKCFMKVIVTQKNTYDYLIKNNLCDERKIEYIYGIVTPKDVFGSTEKKYFNNGKNTMDICFVAHKYSRYGADKGYDIFVDVAKALVKKYDDIFFHVVGGFDENVIDVKELKDKIKFYGIQPSERLREIFSNMDIIVSPNRPNMLKKGAFDGFPTGSCTEAMINGVMLICTDELHLNSKYKDGKELIITKPDVEIILSKIEELHKNKDNLIKIAKNGRKKAWKVYSETEQIKPRVKIIKGVAKEVYKNK